MKNENFKEEVEKSLKIIVLPTQLSGFFILIYNVLHLKAIN